MDIDDVIHPLICSHCRVADAHWVNFWNLGDPSHAKQLCDLCKGHEEIWDFKEVDFDGSPKNFSIYLPLLRPDINDPICTVIEVMCHGLSLLAQP